ncbi:MAG: tail fiber protein [Verrucomicrobia bacterium]|nr:tail fiber protein [Verrucomicrobiota bacterium]
MASPFIGEIIMFAGNFAPKNYAFCNGQLMNIAQNTALFSILGTTYGGNGTANFGLPNLQGSLPVGYGQGPGRSNYVLGQTGGAAVVTLTAAQLPVHTHQSAVNAATAPTTANPVGAYPATPASGTPYAGTGGASMAAGASGSLGSVGGSQPHNNLMPSLCVNFVIALFGIFPSRN